MKKKETKEVKVITKRRRARTKAEDQKKVKKALPAKAKKAPPAKMSNEKRDFSMRVKKDMENILPNKMPWKIGINKDIFEALKVKYTGKRRSLRRIISCKLNNKVNSASYMNAMLKESCRYGIGLVQYPLSDEDIQSCRVRLDEIKNRKAKKR